MGPKSVARSDMLGQSSRTEPASVGVVPSPSKAHSSPTHLSQSVVYRSRRRTRPTGPAIFTVCRVEEERGGVQGRRRLKRATSFVVALAEKPIAPFPSPAHRTGRDHFGHLMWLTTSDD